jgi:hypothetical protein
MTMNELTRRLFLSSITVTPLVRVAAAQSINTMAGINHVPSHNIAVDEVDDVRNGFDPHPIMTDWDVGSVNVDTQGRKMCQAQRGILEISFADHELGLYMFHAHQSESAELEWMNHFGVVS